MLGDLSQVLAYTLRKSDDTTRWTMLPQHFVKPLHEKYYAGRSSVPWPTSPSKIPTVLGGECQFPEAHLSILSKCCSVQRNVKHSGERSLPRGHTEPIHANSSRYLSHHTPRVTPRWCLPRISNGTNSPRLALLYRQNFGRVYVHFMLVCR